MLQRRHLALQSLYAIRQFLDDLVLSVPSLGFLSLGSRPSASIFIDGVDIGRTTPLVQWPLKVGKHKVRLVLGNKRRDMTVEVRSGQTANEIVDLRKK